MVEISLKVKSFRNFSLISSTMKLALATIFLCTLIFEVQSAPHTINFAGMKGMIDVNGEETNVNQKSLSKVEEVLKGLIQKYLKTKKLAKKPVKEETPEAPEIKVEKTIPSNLQSVNWDEHPESRDMFNKQIPCGTASIDALLKLFREQQQKSKV
jgi:hypothetical protein